MKKFISIICAVSMLFAVAGCGGGCKNVTKTAYQSSGITHITATTALDGFNRYLAVRDQEIAALHATDPAKAAKERAKIGEQVAQVKSVYEKYQASQLTLLTAAQEFSKLPPESPDAGNSQLRLEAALSASSITLSELIGLIQKFGVKL